MIWISLRGAKQLGEILKESGSTPEEIIEEDTRHK